MNAWNHICKLFINCAGDQLPKDAKYDFLEPNTICSLCTGYHYCLLDHPRVYCVANDLGYDGFYVLIRFWWQNEVDGWIPH